MASLDQLYALRYNSNVPPDEKVDVNAELLGEILDLARAGDLFPDQQEVNHYFPLFARASTLYPSFQQYAVGERGFPGHKAILYLNEYGIVDTGRSHSRYLEKGWMGGFEFLRDMVSNVDVIQAIIRTDVNQVLRFLKPYVKEDDSPTGFHWARLDGEDLDINDQARVEYLTQWILDCGEEHDPCKRDRLRIRDLKQFVTQLLWSTLGADACPIEMERTRRGQIVAYRNVDYTTIRLTSESGYEGDDEIRAVQLYQQVPAVTFGYQDLLYETRNPNVDVHAGGYGSAEPEGFIRAVTGYLNACTYNASGIDSSSVPRGALVLYGKFDRPQLIAAKREIQSWTMGAHNRHRPLILSSETREGGVDWKPIDQFNDMNFARLVTLYISLLCASYGKNPDEINCDSFSMRTSAFGGKADEVERLAHAYEKGAGNRLAFVGDVLNKLASIQQVALWGRRLYRLTWTGLRRENEQWEQERARLTRTTDELRAMDGLEPSKDKTIGNAPAGNPSLMPIYAQKAMPQPEPQPGAEAQPGNGGGNGKSNGKGPEQGEANTEERERRVAKAQLPKGVRWLGDFAVIES